MFFFFLVLQVKLCIVGGGGNSCPATHNCQVKDRPWSDAENTEFLNTKKPTSSPWDRYDNCVDVGHSGEDPCRRKCGCGPHESRPAPPAAPPSSSSPPGGNSDDSHLPKCKCWTLKQCLGKLAPGSDFAGGVSFFCVCFLSLSL